MHLESLSGVFEEIRMSSIMEPNFRIRPNNQEIASLAGSIARQGLLHPLLVRVRDGKFELVSGSRRLAACRLLGWRKVQCQVVELTDQEAFEMSLAENIARKSMEPIEEARAFQEYIKRYGWGSEKDIARRIGKSPSFVSRRLRLLELPDEALQEIFRRRKNPSLAEEILAVEDDELRRHFVNLSSELELSSKEVRRLNKSLAQGRELQVGLGISTGDFREDRRHQALRNAIQRTVVALRVALHRLDEVFENVDEDEWVIKEVLMQQRFALHTQLDLVCNLTKRLEKLPAPKL